MTIPVLHTLEPAYTVIERLGGKRSVANRLLINKSTVSRWCQPKPYGTGGVIPQRYWQQLIGMAQDKHVVLTLGDLAFIGV